MAFVLTAHTSYWWPVEVRLPDPHEPGQMVRQTFRAKFHPLLLDRAIAAEQAMKEEADPAAYSALECQTLRELVLDWAEVVNDAGEPVAFSAEVFEVALQRQWFRQALFHAFYQSQSGRDTGRLH